MEDQGNFSPKVGIWLRLIVCALALVLLTGAYFFGLKYINTKSELTENLKESLAEINAVQKCVEASDQAMKAFVAADQTASNIVFAQEKREALKKVLSPSLNADDGKGPKGQAKSEMFPAADVRNTLKDSVESCLEIATGESES